MFQPFYPEKIWLEERVSQLAETKEILSRLSNVPVEIIADVSRMTTDIAEENKKILALAKQEGSFLKPCPGTQNYICCNYYFLNLATNCDVNCSYCILQGYLDNPYMTVYTNLEGMFAEMDDIFKQSPNSFYRIGTGELTDSLTLDHITEYSKKLIPFFLRYPNTILELKTKTIQIKNLLDFSPEKRVIISWSLNPDSIIQTEEKNAPDLQQRLDAAQACAGAGYLIGFHFDPLICYPQWQSDYRKVVKSLFQAVPADQIVWISLGALRYPVEMDRIIRQRHPQNEIVLGEMFRGKDGKLRYFRPIREKMFQKMIQWIREENEHVRIYLCMESPEVWQRSFGFQPLSQCGLPRQLDRAVYRCRNGVEIK